MPKVEIPDEDFDFGGDKKPADKAKLVSPPDKPQSLPVVDEDDWHNREPKETEGGVDLMRRDSNKLLWGVLIVAGIVVAGVGGYYKLRGDGSGDKEKKTQKSAISENVTPGSGEKQVADFEIECSFNFTPPSSYTAVCEGQFDGNPKISFNRIRKGDNSWDARVEVEQGGKQFVCPAVIKKPNDKKTPQKGLGGGGQVLKCVSK